MAGLRRFNYTGKDHAAIVADCAARIKEHYGAAKWNDFEEDSAGVMLLEAFAYVADLLLFYLDHQANESYLPTATERQNLINLCKLIGYRVSGARPAQVDLTFSLNRPHGYSVTIPKGTQISTAQGGIVFELAKAAVIPAGETSIKAPASQGETFDELIGLSDGTAWQEVYLPRSGIIELQRLTIGGHEWSACDSLAEHLAGDRVFTLSLDAWGRGLISFGDGKTGAVPHNLSEIRAVYRVGGGSAGNVAPNTINMMRAVAADENGDSVSVEVTNEEWAAGGADPESADSIRLNAPKFFETQNRCVTQGDYEAFARSYGNNEQGRICKARAVVRERSGEANVIRIYVLAYGGQTGNEASAAPQPLKDSLLTYLNEYKMLTDWIEIEDGRITPVDIRGTLRISAGVKPSEALDGATEALTRLLSVDTRALGEALRISDVYAAIDNVSGVLHVELETPKETVEAAPNEFLTLGALTLAVEVQGAGTDGTNI